ncbi:hypothetical protein NMG60_11008548 [Bertholletia excelsa]
MSLNHFSSDIPEGALCWSTQQSPMEPTHKTSQFHHSTAAAAGVFCSQNTAFSFNLNQSEDDDEALSFTDERDSPTTTTTSTTTAKLLPELPSELADDDKEPMFEKPLTPSDVGKLNRLVIPKQHAEKYFPLAGGGGSGDGAGEKGVVLSFEDEAGKCWRFRYSYWNSSQSYVLTKGWSRYVKEKRLDAGDVVLFERHRIDGGRLFIRWRRRSTAGGVAHPVAAAVGNSGVDGWTRVFYSAHSYPPHPHHGSPIPHLPHSLLHAGRVVESQTGHSGGNSKRLRLFGVNLECQQEAEEALEPEGSCVWRQEEVHQTQGHYYHYFTNPHASNTQTHMDINFSRNVNQMSYRQG